MKIHLSNPSRRCASPARSARRLTSSLVAAATLAAGLPAAPSSAVSPEFPDQYVKVPVSVSGAYRPVVGNFDGTGQEEVFWWGVGAAADSLWRINSITPFSRSSFVQQAGFSRETRPMAGDFDGDGRDDIFWYTPGTGADAVWYSEPGFTWDKREVVVNGTYLATAGHFHGAARTDILWATPGDIHDTEVHWWSANATRGSFTSHASQPIDGWAQGDGQLLGVVTRNVEGLNDEVSFAVRQNCCSNVRLVGYANVIPGGQPDFLASVGDFSPEISTLWKHLTGVGGFAVLTQDPWKAQAREGGGTGDSFVAPPHDIVSGSHSGELVVWHSPGPATDELWFKIGEDGSPEN